MITHYLFELTQTKKSILLLQGSIRLFFKNVADWLKKSGCNIYKINLNNGCSLLLKDHDFYPCIKTTSVDENRGKSHCFFSIAYKCKAKLKQIRLTKNVVNNEYKSFYIFPLQYTHDIQIQVYSKYHAMKSYLAKVICSFTHFADDNRYLVIKHNPMDEGFNDYALLIKKLTKRYGVEKRVIYIQDIPTSIRRGTVNCTYAFSALMHGALLLLLAISHHDIKELTFQDSLDAS